MSRRVVPERYKGREREFHEMVNSPVGVRRFYRRMVRVFRAIRVVISSGFRGLGPDLRRNIMSYLPIVQEIDFHTHVPLADWAIKSYFDLWKRIYNERGPEYDMLVRMLGEDKVNEISKIK